MKNEDCVCWEINSRNCPKHQNAHEYINTDTADTFLCGFIVGIAVGSLFTIASMVL